MTAEQLQVARENSIMFLKVGMTYEQIRFVQSYACCPSSLHAIWVGVEDADFVKDRLAMSAFRSEAVTA